MSNAVYKGKTYSASYYEDRKPNSVLIRSKHVQEEEGFKIISDNKGYCKYVAPNDIDEYYDFHFYAVFGDTVCEIMGVSDDMERMAFQEWGSALREKYHYVAQIDIGCYLYEQIPVKDADSFVLKLEYRDKTDFVNDYETEEISLSCEEFAEKYRSLVTDVF